MRASFLEQIVFALRLECVSSHDQPGTRILYWVRGNYRVRDNLALSAAMWLSTQLRMPLQASVIAISGVMFILGHSSFSPLLHTPRKSENKSTGWYWSEA